MPAADHLPSSEPDIAPGRADAAPATSPSPSPSPSPAPRTRPEPALEQLFDGDSLFALRSAVAAHGSELGLDEQALADLVLVAHELATNAVRHGGASAENPGRLRLWGEVGAVVCQVSDPGPGPGPAAGTTRAPLSAQNGRGLWIIRSLARQLDITAGPEGTTVTAILRGAPA